MPASGVSALVSHASRWVTTTPGVLTARSLRPAVVPADLQPTGGTYPPAAATVLPVGVSTPDSPKFPYAPELCAFMLDNFASLGLSFPLHPVMFTELGLNVSTDAARAFLKAVMGASTAE